jgi:hypothetical protein
LCGIFTQSGLEIHYGPHIRRQWRDVHELIQAGWIHLW